MIAEICKPLQFQTQIVTVGEEKTDALSVTCHSIGSHRSVVGALTKIHDADPSKKVHVPQHPLLDRETIQPPPNVTCTIEQARNTITNRDYLLLKPALQGQVLRLLINVSQKKSGQVSKNILVEPAMEQYIEFKPRGGRSPLASDYQVDIIAAERTAPVTPAPKDPEPSPDTPATEPPPTSSP